jgi:endonuclease YncB( thermonuclease family)
MRSPYALACIIATLLCAAVLGVGWYRAVAAEASISGPVRVIDADTVVVSGIHVRLKGVDAAELGSDLGEAARLMMIRIVGNSVLTCELTGEKTYGREVGYCTTAAGVDINKEIIAQGAALSCPRYSDRYLKFEQALAIKAQQRAKYCVQ